MTIIPRKQRIRALLLSLYKMPTSSIVKPRCSRCFGRVMLWEEYKRLCGKLCNKDYQLKSASKWRTLFRPMVIPNVFSIVLGSKTKTHFTSFLRYVNFALAFGRNFIDGSMFRSPISPLSTHFIRHLSLIGPGKRKGWLIWKYKNDTIFNNLNPNMHKLLDEAKGRLWSWRPAKFPRVRELSFLGWCADPFAYVYSLR